ncbi:MAG: methyltransferase domain-containing protein [Dinghuibacter sp.]|nr:methyltransferase domain-containing protein [Dinghuibacter sp.]
METLVKNYDPKRASEYDSESTYDKGNREMHLDVLKDLLTYKPLNPERIVELGCGTGFFSTLLAQVFPMAELVLVDGSEAMLNKSRQKLGTRIGQTYVQSFLQQFNWNEWQETDIVFSALTIHHLADEEKTELYRHIHRALKPGGMFIYFDQFRTGSTAGDELLEYLACRDMQRKLRGNIPDNFVIPELSIEEIIKNDRKVKSGDDDKEAVFAETLQTLEQVFHQVHCVFQEARYYGLLACR